MSDLAQDLKALLVECHDDPLLYAEKVLRATPRVWQRKALEAIRARLQAGDVRLEILIRACHSAGKSWLMAVIVLWYMSTRPEARGLTTAEVWRTVEEILWPEIRRLYAGSMLADLNVGRCLNAFLEFGPAWLCAGAASDRPETLEGPHSPTAGLRVVDEGKSVPSAVFTSTEAILASPESLDMWGSTPSIRAGDFYERDIFGAPSVIRLVVTADDLIEEGVPGIAEWKAECARKWGVDSADYRSRVMGEYIEEGEGALYPFSHVERAMSATWDVDSAPVGGFDCAGSVDGDENVVALSSGPDDLGRYRFRIAGAWKEHDTMVSKGRALALLRAAGAVSVNVDSIGLGKGVHDALAMDFKACTEYRASDRPEDPVRFVNRKAEDAWNMRELLEKGLARLPADPVVRAQFLAEKYEINAQGKLRVIDPSDSPDRHDAILISRAGPCGGAFITFMRGELERKKHGAAPVSTLSTPAHPYVATPCEYFSEPHSHDPYGECLTPEGWQRVMPPGWRRPAHLSHIPISSAMAMPADYRERRARNQDALNADIQRLNAAVRGGR